MNIKSFIDKEAHMESSSHMHLVYHSKGVSRLLSILLLLLFFTVGALFSYVYTMGFYADLRLPSKPAITLESVELHDQNTSFFNITLLNPSYSSRVEITRIEARTPDDNRIHVIADIQPALPYPLERGEIQTFQAKWNWANYTDIKLPYTDQPIEIRVFLGDGRGEILEVRRPLTTLNITNLTFNPSISVDHFNVTIQNLESSGTYVNVTTISLNGNIMSSEMVAPTLPYTLNPGDSPLKLQCFHNWTEVQGKEVTVRISTLQGYIAERIQVLPDPVTLNISQFVFNATVSTTHFNITVSNAANSSTYVDINRIAVAVGSEAPVDISQWIPDPSSRLEKNAFILIMCAWDWSSYSGQSLTTKVTVYTSQGFTVSREVQIP